MTAEEAKARINALEEEIRKGTEEILQKKISLEVIKRTKN